VNFGQFILVGLSLIGYGICSACKDGTLWQDERLRFEVNWGGNSKWIWSSDTWHTFKHLEQFFMYLAIFFASGLMWYWAPLFVLIASGVVGRTFVLFYHTLLLKEPDQTIADWIKGTWPWSDKK